MTLGTQASFEDLGTPLAEVTFCVLDLETTGGSPATSRITEVGAARYRMGEELATFQTLVDPKTEIPPFITILTGITQAMVTQAPSIETVLPSLLEFIGEAVVVGHNLRFDLSFLDAAARRLGYPPLPNRTVDTVALARRLLAGEVRNLKLATLAAHLRSPVSPTHRALDDARATAHVLWGLLERAGTLGVTGLDDLCALPTARGGRHYRKIELTDSLPRKPGVYLFCDSDGAVFYVGKATNLRARTRSYFYGDERRAVTDMLRLLARIDHRVCSGALEAEVTELRLIHRLRPRYNRRSRPPRSSLFLKLTDERFPRLSVGRGMGGRACLGPFRSRRAAEEVMMAIWDAVALRRCTHRPHSLPAPCGPAQLGAAACPGDGSLRPEQYRPVVEAVLRGVEEDPRPLLFALERRMVRLAAEQRFEEAAAVRDRHRALARALERRRQWQALTAAGRIEAMGEDGVRVVIEAGRLIHAGGESPLLWSEPLPPASTPVPPDLAAAEEAAIIWRWLSAPGTRLLDVEGPLTLPAAPVPVLRAG